MRSFLVGKRSRCIDRMLGMSLEEARPFDIQRQDGCGVAIGVVVGRRRVEVDT